jgi:hypothetical protein
MSNSSGSNKPPIENWGISDEYLILDSFEKLESSNTRQGEMVFNLGIKYPTSNQVTGINNDLTNIIEFEIGSFYMPPIPLLPYITNDNVDPVTLVLGPVPDRTLPRLIINTSDIVQTGKIIAQGTPEEIKNTDNPLVCQFIKGEINGPFQYKYESKIGYNEFIGI